jgi:WbqC-like protein family
MQGCISKSRSCLKRIAIIQSSYIPWRGFFDLIGRCDLYVIYDTAAFSKGHWHNRNRIKRASGDSWLSIPVKTASRLGQPMDEVEIAKSWVERHWAIIKEAYQTAPFFEAEASGMEAIFAQVARETSLSKVNEGLLRWVAGHFGLNTEIRRDREFEFEGDRNQRLVDICTATRATHYLSGPSAKDYLDTNLFSEAGVTVEWMQYGPYPEYPQLHGAFDGAVSILDVLFNCGSKDVIS